MSYLDDFDMRESISVICDDQSTRGELHRGRTARVATFDVLAGEWFARAGDRYAGPERAHKTEDLDTARTSIWVNAAGEVSNTKDTVFDHAKFVLRCELCGLDLQVRAERAQPVLDALSSNGIDQVSLTALSAML